MSPEDLLRRVQGLIDVAGRADDAARRGARGALKGVRVRGHRVSMDGMRIRVTGPVAPGVAERLSGMAARGVDDAFRDLLDGAR